MRLSSGELARIDTVKRDDSVWTPSGPARVRCVVVCDGARELWAVQDGPTLTKGHPFTSLLRQFLFLTLRRMAFFFFLFSERTAHCAAVLALLGSLRSQTSLMVQVLPEPPNPGCWLPAAKTRDSVVVSGTRGNAHCGSWSASGGRVLEPYYNISIVCARARSQRKSSCPSSPIVAGASANVWTRMGEGGMV